MNTKIKLLLIVALMLIGLGLATIVNISLNFREYSIKSATQKAEATAAIVKDGLTAHMVNGIMDKRDYFLNQIYTNNADIKALWIIRSDKVKKQFGNGFKNETVRDALDKKVLASGKTVQTIKENADGITLRISIPYNATSTGTPNCLKCHNVQDGDTLGAISMEFDITHMRNDGMLTILKILGINLIFIIIALILINHYVSPYMQLFSNMQEGIKKAYRGDFTHKFKTSVTGDGKILTEQLNTLFAKMQETFGDIKHNLATFIPQGCVSSNDPLYEAKTIINELSDIYKFKKTIELDSSKEIVYNRIIDVLSNKFDFEHFAFYEINTKNNHRELIYISQGKSICNSETEEDAMLCRAYRTKTDIISTEFIHLCQECSCEDLEYVCIPFDINDEYSLVISITTKNPSDIARINKQIPSIKNYLEAAKPVIESRILTDKLRETSLKDPMTGLYNRRFLEEFIEKFVKQAQRRNETYAVLMLDIDFFKQVNDTYGHDVGDTVIAQLGKVIRQSVRESDLAIRYGGEEFVVLLQNATHEGAMRVAELINESFAALSFDVGAGESIQKTISIGIAIFPEDAETIWKCIKLADTALYVAKTTGRNKIVEYKEEMSQNDNLR
ncbi:MAG TPA: GGDEF domain-containing protein [Sulfurimonas autotrophica]|uniref:diguanylate cyclase n=1 Tax=Sulfurimonas autotrophica TaxID=202747 RepID=A0A7C3FVL0_9BACT|nr:GGDEF domain-containing protein [Sulfurimonas autotrophica]